MANLVFVLCSKLFSVCVRPWITSSPTTEQTQVRAPHYIWKHRVLTNPSLIGASNCFFKATHFVLDSCCSYLSMTSETAWNTSFRSEPATARTALERNRVPLSLGKKASDLTHLANSSPSTSVDSFTREKVPTCMYVCIYVYMY